MSNTEIKPRGCNKTANMCFLATVLLQRIAQNQVTQEFGRHTRHSTELERRRFLACLLVVGGGGWPPVPWPSLPIPALSGQCLAASASSYQALWELGWRALSAQ